MSTQKETKEKEWKQAQKERFDHRKPKRAVFETEEGLSEDIIRELSKEKNEPEWMLERRLRSFENFKQMPMPDWGPSLHGLNLEEVVYYLKTDEDTRKNDWEDVPEDIKDTFDKLGIPEAEREALGGVGAQYESEVYYQNMKDELENQGVVFTDIDTAIQEHEELVKEYFMTKCVPPSDNKFAALHGAVHSGGSFVYVPEGVDVGMPIQAYFRMNSKSMGQFEHTLIIAEDNSDVHYIEGCSAPQYTKHNLHAGCVEVFVGEDAHVQYSTVQNWSKNTFNLNTKRAIVERNGRMDWVSGSMGSKKTMLYPMTILKGEGSSDRHITIGFAGEGQDIDTGAKVSHIAPNTSSTIESKSVSMDGGRTNYRGLVRVSPGAEGVKSSVDCDALMLDSDSISDTMPFEEVNESKVDVAHEASVGSIGDEEVFYLQSRGIDEDEAKQMIVSGFIEPIVEELPLEYAVELNRLVELEMEGSLG